MYNFTILLKSKKNGFFALALIFTAILFLPLAADARVENCSTDKFSTGSKTQILTFPAGGGYNSDAKVSLPISAVISDTKVDLAPKNVIGTPYIWIPNTASNTFAQIRTKDGTLVKLYQNGVDGFPATAFNGNSRVTLIPGGDVWVANRLNTYVTWLEPKGGGSEEYKYGGQVDMGASLVRGITFDKNGYIWAGTLGSGSDRIKVICASAACGGKGTVLATLMGASSYGMIGDKYGYVWVQNGGAASYSYSGGTITPVDSVGLTSPYGIGIDNDQNIWYGRWGAPMGASKVVRGLAGNIISVTSYASGLASNSGIAIDGAKPLGNVWVAGYNTNMVSRFLTDGSFVANYPVGAFPHGVAIDFDNNAWIVNINGGSPGSQPILNPSGCAGSGTVTKLKSDGTYIATYSTCGNGPYNYSDMTGFRSIPTTLSVGATEFTPTSGSTYTGFGLPLQAALAACSCPDANGFEQCAIDPTELNSCLVPLSLFSVTGGDYNATNLNIECSITYPDITGGLVPCGRLDDNTATGDIDESKPCTLCALFYMLKNIINFVLDLAVKIGVFILIIAGLLYALSAGNSRRIELAKSAATSAIIGLVIVFVAWLAIAVILQAMGFANVGVWNQVNCAL